MKRFGYDKDTGSLFSWDQDFLFEGSGKVVPEGAFVSEDRIRDEMTGCAFMSGWTGKCIVISSDGETDHASLLGFVFKEGYLFKGLDVDQEELKKMSVGIPICVCGSVVLSAEKIASLCALYPNSRMYVCPLVYGLSALGVLVRNADKTFSPRRMQITCENKEPIDAEFKEFDTKLDGDGLGRMADLVTHGLLVVNEMKTVQGVSPFFGKTLHRDWMPGSQVIVRRAEIDSLFPQVPISAKDYAATSVFVKMKTTDQFRDAAGYNEPFVDVVVSTDYLPELSTFMRFYKTFSGRGFVFVSEQNLVRHKEIVPVFRANKAYRVLRGKYENCKAFGK
jgi:hypothetical protein